MLRLGVWRNWLDALETTSGNSPDGSSKGGSNGNAPRTGSNPATPHILQHEMPRSKPDRRDVRIPSAGAVFEKRVFFFTYPLGDINYSVYF